MDSFRADHNRHTVKVCRPHKGYVNSEVPMVGRAVKAEIYAKRYRSPCWVLLPTVKAYLCRVRSAYLLKMHQGAYLVGRFRLQFFKDLMRLSFRCEGAHGAGDAK